MIMVGMHQAKTQLSELVQRAEGGEEIVITRNGTPVVTLTAIPKANRMAEAFGALKDTPAVFHDDFDEIPEEIAVAFGIPQGDR
ncbi:MAG: type II toxin-antitoxin system prevent-host-death family antitoxin [Solirubrobacterales bacterium]|nr:type II toxin-antitoxin system prevent-host-death family antitoxin [Solirubrobacterales bacterium]